MPYVILKPKFRLWIIIPLILPILLKAQYPDIIEMHNSMIGEATVKARVSVKHLPGFRVKAGLYYRALIDPNFQGTGSSYNPPAEPNPVVVNASSNLNYIITYTPLKPGYNPLNTTQDSSNNLNVDIKYFDGLGRDLQDVSVMASPDQRDFIKYYKYDPSGRPEGDFLPYKGSNANGAFEAGYEVNQRTFYNNIYPNEGPYAQTDFLYENSPLNRILKQASPGCFFSNEPNDEHVTEFQYLTNTSEVNSWTVENNSINPVNYAANQLFINVTKNENSANRTTTREYKDKLDRVIIKETFDGTSWLATHYIYDEFNLLRCVIPPKASGPADTSLCYFYQYDKRQRMIMKKIPGADSIFMVYDKRDRLVLSQDGNMQRKQQWLLICYDELNRMVMSGILRYGSGISQAAMQDRYNSVVSNLNERLTGKHSDANQGYTRNVASLLSSAGAFDVVSVTYYDSYTWKDDPEYRNFEVPGVVSSTDFNMTGTKTMVTGTKIKVENNGDDFLDWITTASYYDNKYRLLQVISDNPNTTEGSKITNKYSFDGKLLITVTSHKAYSTELTCTEKFVYDHRGRMLEHTLEGLPGQGQNIMLASNHYNSLGQLAQSQSHGEYQGNNWIPFIQNTQFLYNIRGWLTHINDPSDTQTENDVFAQKMHYSDGFTGGTVPPQFNGNIAAIEWATNRPNERFAYEYQYDAVNRLTGGSFFNYGGGSYTHDGSYDETGITYDKNGNIKTLSRNADHSIPIDQLDYRYLNNGNQLEKIIDPTQDFAGYIDYPGSTSSQQTYSYDANGNMITSQDKGITTPILYSYLNKPVEIDFGSGEKLQYIYDGAGNKIAKKVLSGNSIQEGSMIYLGNFVYDWQGTLLYFLTSEGRIVKDNKNYRFEYFMKDHLGNTRATYAQAAPGLPQIAEYTHYYPFGMRLEKLSYVSGADLTNLNRYNGKELQPDYGLEWYDYGARMYDPAIGRWHSMDIKAENFIQFSPYNYCVNNSIIFIDPNGMSIDEYELNIETGEFKNVKPTDNDVVYTVRSNEVGKTERTGEKIEFKGKPITENLIGQLSAEGKPEQKIHVNNTLDGNKLFNFFKEHTGASQEWCLIDYKSSQMTKFESIITTSGLLGKDPIGSNLVRQLSSLLGFVIEKFDHNHPKSVTAKWSSEGDRNIRDCVLKNNSDASINIHYLENNIWSQRSIRDDNKYFYDGSF